MADLVALLEIDVRRLRRERKPPDDGDQGPADRYEKETASDAEILSGLNTVAPRGRVWVGALLPDR